MKKKWVALLTGLVAAAMMTGAAMGEETYKIGFSVKTLTNEPFQAFIADEIKTKVEEAGCEFALATTDSAEDIAQQVSQIEDLLESGINALILNPLDSNAVIPALEKCKEAGVPVIIVDSPPAEGTDTSLYVTFIGTDNYQGSVQAGQAMIDVLGEGKVVIVRGMSGNTAGEARANGFKDGVKDSTVEVVAEQAGNWNNDDALQAMENMLVANPDITGVYSCSDVMLDGIIEAIDNNDLKDKITIISFDGLTNGCELVKDGAVYATMQQNPAVMGDLAVEYLIAILKGEKTADDFEKFIDSGVTYVTQENAEEALNNAP